MYTHTKTHRPAHGRAVHQPDQEQQCEEDEGEQEPEAGGGSWRRRLWLYWRGLASTGFLLSLVRAWRASAACV